MHHRRTGWYVKDLCSRVHDLQHSTGTDGETHGTRLYSIRSVLDIREHRFFAYPHSENDFFVVKIGLLVRFFFEPIVER